MAVVLGIVVVTGIIALAVVTYRREKQRLLGLRRWAAERRFTFAAARDKTLADQFADFGILHRGYARHAKNVMIGTCGDRPVWAFDYAFTTGSGRSRRTHRFSAVVIRSAHPLIPLTIRREHFFDRVGEFVGFDDIDFESAEFSRRFCVKSPDRRWAYDVIHTQMMEYLLAHADATVQFDNWHVIAYRMRRFSPAQFTAALRLVEGILERIPDYVVRQLSGQTGLPTEPVRPATAPDKPADAPRGRPV